VPLELMMKTKRYLSKREAAYPAKGTLIDAKGRDEGLIGKLRSLGSNPPIGKKS